MIKNFRYSSGYVQCLRDPAAHDFLVAVGLPANHVIFVARETPGAGAVLRVAGRELIKIGAGSESDDIGAYCVDCGTGAVIYVDAHDLSELHVNASPELFSNCLTLFESKIEDAAQGPDETDPEQLAQLLEAEILRIDPSALADNPGFWRSLLDDVTVGDYLEEDSDS